MRGFPMTRPLLLCVPRGARSVVAAMILSLLFSAYNRAHADEGHAHEQDDRRMRMVQEMIDEHAEHDHGHEFTALEGMTPERMRAIMVAMTDIGIAVPSMNSELGRKLFVNKGCIACHSVNGVGGEMGPSLDAADMPKPMNAFEFSARMWRGAPAMAELQQELLGDVISLNGQELADIIAFAHDAEEQSRLTRDGIPAQFREMIGE